jgi:hypothetical protein
MPTRAETKVEAVSPYKLVILAYDTEVRTEFGVTAMIEFLDGPRAGESMPSGTKLRGKRSESTCVIDERYGATRTFVRVLRVNDDSTPQL